MRNLGVVNGYKIEESCAEEEGLKDIYIEYLNRGRFFTSSKYSNVPSKKVEKIRESLFEDTLHNLNAKTQQGAIPLLTILYNVQAIIDEK